MYVVCVCIYICGEHAHMGAGAVRGQRRGSGALELELQAAAA